MPKKEDLSLRDLVPDDADNAAVDEKSSSDDDIKTDEETPKEPTIADLIGAVNALGETYQEQMDRLSSIEEKMTVTPISGDPAKETNTNHAGPNQPEWYRTILALPEKAKEEAINATRGEFERIQKEQIYAQKNELETQRKVDQIFDAQLLEAEKAGHLPVVKDPNDPNDAGRKARAEVFSFAQALDTLNIQKVAEQLAIHHANGYVFDQKSSKLIKQNTNTRPAGLRAPIGSSGNRTDNAPSGPSYKEIHNTSMGILASRYDE